MHGFDITRVITGVKIFAYTVTYAIGSLFSGKVEENVQKAQTEIQIQSEIAESESESESESKSETKYLRKATVEAGNNVEYIVCETLGGKEIRIPNGEDIFLSSLDSDNENEYVAIWVNPEGKDIAFLISADMVSEKTEKEGTPKVFYTQYNDNTVRGFVGCYSVITTEDTIVKTNKGDVQVDSGTELIAIPDETDEENITVFVRNGDEIEIGTINVQTVNPYMGYATEDYFNMVYGEKGEKEEKEEQIAQEKEEQVAQEEQEQQEEQVAQEEQEQQGEQVAQEEQEQADTEKVTKRKLTYYSQTDPKFSGIVYDNPATPNTKETVGPSGCGLMSCAMVAANAVGDEKAQSTIEASNDVEFVKNLADIFMKSGIRVDGGTSCQATKKIQEIFGIKEYHPYVSFDELKDYLSQKYSDGTSKYFAICHCNPGIFTRGGHVIAVMGYDPVTDEYKIYDPNRDGGINSGRYQEYSGVRYSGYSGNSIYVERDSFEQSGGVFATFVVSNGVDPEQTKNLQKSNNEGMAR